MTGDVDGAQAEVVQGCREPVHEVGQLRTTGQTITLAMAGHVDGDDAMVASERRDLRCPCFKTHADAMDEEQRLATPPVDIGRAAAGPRPMQGCQHRVRVP